MLPRDYPPCLGILGPCSVVVHLQSDSAGVFFSEGEVNTSHNCNLGVALVDVDALDDRGDAPVFLMVTFTE